MSTINFDTGIVTYDINGKYSFTVNPTDAGFAKKLFSAFEELKAYQAEHERDEEENKVTDSYERMAKRFEQAKELDEKMRGVVDNALGDGASDALFGTMNLFAWAGGVPAWLNLWFALVFEVVGKAEEQHAMMNPRLEEYMARYKSK